MTKYVTFICGAALTTSLLEMISSIQHGATGWAVANAVGFTLTAVGVMAVFWTARGK